MDYSTPGDIQPMFFYARLQNGVVQVAGEEGAEMILQSLVRHYDALAAKDMISPVGWSTAKVTFALEITPNASRLSVRFFLQNEFGSILKNLHEHNRRLEIARPSFETKTSLPLWNLLNETANQNARNKTPPPPMAGAVLLSILLGTDYPASLFENVMLRIRAEHDISW